MSKSRKLNIAYTLLFWPAFFIAAQYYLLFPGIIAELPSHIVDSNKMVTVGYTDSDEKYFYYRSASEDAPLIIYLHGNYETIDQNLHPLLGQTGYKSDILLLEYKGYGETKGWPNPSSIVRTSENLLKQYKRNPHQKVIIWGRSLGGSLSAQLASKTSPDALILESTFLHPSDIFENEIVKSLISPLVIFDFDTQHYLQQLPTNLPILVLHGERDELFPVKTSYQMVELLKAKGNPVEHHVFDGDHNKRNYSASIPFRFIKHIREVK